MIEVAMALAFGSVGAYLGKKMKETETGKNVDEKLSEVVDTVIEVKDQLPWEDLTDSLDV